MLVSKLLLYLLSRTSWWLPLGAANVVLKGKMQSYISRYGSFYVYICAVMCVCVCMFRRLNKFTWKIIQINEEITIIAAKAKSIWEHWSISRNHKLASKQVNEAFNVTEILRGDREKQATPLPIANWKWKRKRHTVMFIKSVLCFLRFIVYTYSSPPRGWLHHGDTVCERERENESEKCEYILNDTPHPSTHPPHPSLDSIAFMYRSGNEHEWVSQWVAAPNQTKHRTPESITQISLANVYIVQSDCGNCFNTVY